jgi:hypothetical protein
MHSLLAPGLSLALRKFRNALLHKTSRTIDQQHSLSLTGRRTVLLMYLRQTTTLRPVLCTSAPLPLYPTTEP